MAKPDEFTHTNVRMDVLVQVPKKWHAVRHKTKNQIVAMFWSLDDANNWVFGENDSRKPYVDDPDDYEVITIYTRFT